MAVEKSNVESWTLANWPANVFPNNVITARYLIRQHRKELVAKKALTRVGRTLVIIGDNYRGWLLSKTTKVVGYKIPPNSRAHAHKRFGKG